jgi:glucose-1-phosphate cytidylyltransferase
MKVVLFCGGLGLRMREASERTPKPMIPVGNRPLLLHLMKYYAHYGHTDFILCLGYQAHAIKDYFLNYNEALVNDFVLSDGGTVELLRSDIQGWRITFVHTGLRATIGQRLRAVREYLGDDEFFLANYADALTDAPLPEVIADLHERGKIATFLCVQPTHSFHFVALDERAVVTDIQDVKHANIWINGGFFVFRRDIFDYLHEGEELVEAPFRRLIAEEQLLAYRYRGFWAPMDTLKDRDNLESLFESGQPPWAVWDAPQRAYALPNGRGH